MSRQQLGTNCTFKKYHISYSQDQNKALLYKFILVLDRINLYFFSGDYGKNTILLSVTCFLGGVVSITEKEFEVHTVEN